MDQLTTALCARQTFIHTATVSRYSLFFPRAKEFCIPCKMSSYRKNTLVIDFSILPKRPPLDQVEDFLKTFIKLDMADVKNVQLHNLKNCVFVEMSDAGVATTSFATLLYTSRGEVLHPRLRGWPHHHCEDFGSTSTNVQFRYLKAYGTIRQSDLHPKRDLEELLRRGAKWC